MPRWIAAVLVAAGCYRSPLPAASPEPRPAPARPAFQERTASYAHARTRPARPAPERSLIGEAIARLGEFADELCACTDKACADAVSQEMTRWSTEMKKDLGDVKPSDEQMEEVARVTERLSKCMMTAMGYGAPTSPPPPP